MLWSDSTLRDTYGLKPSERIDRGFESYQVAWINIYRSTFRAGYRADKTQATYATGQ
jgi:hypothetical protein